MAQTRTTSEEHISAINVICPCSPSVGLILAAVLHLCPYRAKKSTLTFSVLANRLARPLWHLHCSSTLKVKLLDNVLEKIQQQAHRLSLSPIFPLFLCLRSCPPSGGSTPPGISAPTVTSIPSPISVNGFTGMPPPQANGQPPAEAVFTNGIHHYPGECDSQVEVCKHTWWTGRGGQGAVGWLYGWKVMNERMMKL